MFSAVLTSLNLRSNSLDAEAGKALAGALSVNRVLTNLDLSHNPLRGINLYTNQGTYDPSGIQALASALAGSAVLNKIVLSYNTIKDEGAIYLQVYLGINNLHHYTLLTKLLWKDTLDLPDDIFLYQVEQF